jgi:hypothetical protein
MTCYFAFPASDSLRDGSNTLQDHFNRGVKESQSALFVKVAQQFSDEIVDALLLNIVRASDQHKASTKILESFAGLIKATVHALIKNVLSKMSNEELRPLAAVIRSRRLTLTRGGVTTDYVCFEMPADFHASLRECMAAGTRGEKDTAKMTDLMLRFSDMSHQAFYEDSVAPLKLGFIGRNMVSMGGSAIKKGSHSSTKSLIPTLEGQELIDFSVYFLNFLIEA